MSGINQEGLYWEPFLGFSIERMRQGMDVNNPFINEIKLLYPEEYKISLEASNIINKTL
ncbi:PRD domain-containing protein [Clostridium sp. Cult1]|uniref:PRD domain-containing protein n=1 Tax=Clostridium sp. Cult1 TaxID=2079002 RepID=UPI002351A6B1|nr:PRD domain-containing protein [Clostridium sp. Cult1]MCF6463120.1 hypothetical protein [Clostridium sp. Cult1]